ncbi:MAG: response regulator [Candidatus Krumholzibacteria bacterium]|nr:response regulator [Candidatus Krumholzibacteria bacterium]
MRNNDFTSEIEALRHQVQNLQDQLALFQEKVGLPSYRELFERSADANLVIDGDTFVDCNESTVKMLRYANREELLQTHPSELSPEFQPDGRISYEKANEMMALAFARGSHRFEWSHQRADGEVFPVEVLLTSVPLGNRNVLHVAWREITERKRLEEELRHAHKMEAVGKLAGGIAHDFNNILVAIMGYADILKEGVADRPELAEDAGEIIRASERAAKLTAQLLAFSRKQDLRPEVVDLDVLVGNLTGMIRRLIGEDIEMVLNNASVPLPVKVDPGQLEQVILNVVANARDSMADGGTLTIKTTRGAKLGTNGVDLPAGRYVSLKFTDTGSGMDSEVIARAFEPFFTTKERGRGTGLGLSSVYGIIKQSGGDVRIVSHKGHGTTLEILLPESTEPLSGTRAPESDSKSGTLGNEFILVVEDDEAAARLITRALEREGYRVMVAHNGDDALTLAEQNSWSFDMVLTDVIMPVMSGPVLVARLRQRMPDIPALFMSGYTDDVLERQGFSIEDVDLIRKPFSPDRLLSRVRTFLWRRSSER